LGFIQKLERPQEEDFAGEDFSEEDKQNGEKEKDVPRKGGNRIGCMQGRVGIRSMLKMDRSPEKPQRKKTY